MAKFQLFTDGGSRGNPGNAACASFIFDEQGNLFDFDAKFLGSATNNVAEYQGLLLGVKLARKHKVSTLDIFMDSELVVKQILGEYQIKDENLRQIASKIKSELSQFDSYKIAHVLRAKNKFADRLVNVVLDAQI